MPTPLGAAGWLGACGGSPSDAPEVEVAFQEWMANVIRAIPRGHYTLRSAGEWAVLWTSAPASSGSVEFIQ